VETSSTKIPLHTLITGLPGSGKTSLVKWSLRNIPPQYAVVVYDTTISEGRGVKSLETP
jgi:type IV secretory pathway ATPase VirB11/archaellum biosynthesis ATPase